MPWGRLWQRFTQYSHPRRYQGTPLYSSPKLEDDSGRDQVRVTSWVYDLHCGGHELVTERRSDLHEFAINRDLGLLPRRVRHKATY